MSMDSAAGMIIGMDGKRAVQNNTGLGNYSRYALNMMSLAFPSTQFRLYAPKNKPNERLEPLLERPNVSLSVAETSFGGLGRVFWRTVDLPLDLRRDNVTLYHGLSNELPLTIGGVCPSVVTMHDVIWRRSPADYKAVDRRIYDFKYGRSARIATRVIAISECTKRDLVSDFGIDPAKIDVIYQGVDPMFSLEINTMQRQEIRARYSLPERYAVCVGTVQPRKNQLLVVRALAQLPQSVHLLIVGRMDGPYGDSVRREIGRLGLSGRVKHLQGIPSADLPAIYADAAVSVYPSRYEGFGLPVVESLTVGTPVVAATGSCLEEAGGDGAVYVDPDDVAALAAAMEHIIDDGIYRDKLSRYGRRHVRKFSADTFAKATMASYRKALLAF